jgi:hypothetical protein
MPRPNKAHDELDVLLDGRPVELTEDLVPLVEVADVLRAELASYELDPEVADRHLEQVLDGSATVVRMPARPQPNGWDVRRRVAAVVLAAALVLAPATMASAAALPGQAMYPFKLAIEQLRLASVQWSPTLEAGERTRVADERIEELDRLVELEMFNQVGPALAAVTRAVWAAEAAVAEAVKKEGATRSELSRLVGRVAGVRSQALAAVTNVQSAVLESPAALQTLPLSLANDIRAAVDQSQEALKPPEASPTQIPPTPSPTPSPTPADPPVGPAPTNPSPPPPAPPSSKPSSPPPSAETTTTTTEPPPSTTEPPPSTTQTTQPTTTTGPPETRTEAPQPAGAGGEYSPPDGQAPTEDQDSTTALTPEP